jgi:hypothetical protein
MRKIPYKFRLLLSSCFLNIIFRLKIGLHRKSYYESMTYPLYLQIFHKLIHSNCGKQNHKIFNVPKSPYHDQGKQSDTAALPDFLKNASVIFCVRLPQTNCPVKIYCRRVLNFEIKYVDQSYTLSASRGVFSFAINLL